MRYEQKMIAVLGQWSLIAETHPNDPDEWAYSLALDHGTPDAGRGSDTLVRCEGEVERLKSCEIVPVPRNIVAWMDRMIDQHEKAVRLRRRVAAIWAEMTDGEKAIVRIGMTHAKHASVLEDEGFDGREIALAFMDAAKADGGMAV